MQLSVIILNYNVRYFLEQCVFSVQKALEGIDGEIIVIDNNTLSNNKTQIINEKLIILPQTENIFVNPAWNLGVNISKNEYCY